jgi:hypothetical protein
VKVKKILQMGLLLAAAAALSGCFKTSADELYSLPRASEEYYKLQEQIDLVLKSGAEYASPTGGSNRQSVQLKDIDGNGRNEVIAFFSIPGDKPLKIYVFKEEAGEYAVADIIEGVGTAIESIRYVDMDGDGVSELVVGWQMGTALRHMTLYAVRDLHHTRIADADYTGIAVCDVSGDGNDDVVAVRLPTSETPGEAEVFSLMSDGEIVGGTARLTEGMEAVSRILTGKLSDGATAVFVDGKRGSDLVTDIFTYRDDALTNVSLNTSDGVSDATLRALTSAVYTADINRDGIMEIPSPELLPPQSETNYYAVNWNSFDRYGAGRLVMTTYHNYSDGWYLILPEDWRGRITVRREDAVPGERTLVFSYVRGAARFEDFLRIYTLSGDNREDRARLTGRLRLLEEGDTVYAAELLPGWDGLPLTLSGELVTENFKRNYSDWITGAI